MMTFAEDPELNLEQPRRFAEVCDALRRDGIAPGKRHAASTDALFRLSDEVFLDMVRPGMALYGIYPDAGFRTAGIADLRPAVSLKARVAYVKQLPKGGTAGYGRAYVAKDAVWIATVPVGHADGWPRVAAAGARVRIGGDMYPLVGTVSGNHTIVEIGPEPKVPGRRRRDGVRLGGRLAPRGRLGRVRRLGLRPHDASEPSAAPMGPRDLV